MTDASQYAFSECPHHGYFAGLCQPTLPLTLRVTAASAAAIEQLDDWLSVTLQLEISKPHTPRTQQLMVDSRAAVAWRTLLVGQLFLHLARWPAWVVGDLIKLDQDRAEVLAPHLDGCPRSMTRRVYAMANELVIEALAGRQRPSSDELKSLLWPRLITPLFNLSGAGVSSLPILQAVHAAGIPFRQLTNGGYQLGYAKRARLIERSAVELDSALGNRWSKSKSRTAAVLRAAGLPAPIHILATTEQNAKQAAELLGWPLVVKPADQERSEGVTVDITDLDSFLRAYRVARELSPRVLVERQVAGICYRLLVANGRLLYAIARHPPGVIGDGRQSVAQLIEALAERSQRKPVWLRKASLILDAQTLDCLQSQGMSPADVPAAGQRVNLRRIEASQWGGEIEDVSDQIHPDNVALAAQAAKVLRLSNAGVDLITADITKPWHQTGAIINEMNFEPYFGGNAIARARLPQFLYGYIEADGRIPISVYVGAAAAGRLAAAFQSERAATGCACYLTDHRQSIKPDGLPLPMVARGLFDRTLALLMNAEVEELVIVVQTVELAFSGLPMDWIDRVVHCEGGLLDASGSQPAEVTHCNRLYQLLNDYGIQS